MPKKARPFVSPIAWALFSAYRTIVSIAVAKIAVLKMGLDAPEVWDSDAVASLIEVALPHHAEYIAKHDSGVYHYLFDELEARLLEELQKMLLGTESDKATVENAAAILKESERVMETISQAGKPAH